MYMHVCYKGSLQRTVYGMARVDSNDHSHETREIDMWNHDMGTFANHFMAAQECRALHVLSKKLLAHPD